MRILITGADGQLGHELQKALDGHALTLCVFPEFDLLKPDVERRIVSAQPEVVIHAAAYTDVDGAEGEPEVAMAVNGEGTARIARVAVEIGARLVYFSTDYVFDGRKESPYLEGDRPNPINAYGRSKLEGERKALDLCPETLVIRTSWLYGVQGKNFVNTIMRMVNEGRPLRVVTDQRGAPTFAGDLAEAVARVIPKKLSGIAHAPGDGSCTWYEFAEAIVRVMGKSVPITPITSNELQRPADRPRNSVLANQTLAEAGIVLPHWTNALARFMKSLSAGEKRD